MSIHDAMWTAVLPQLGAPVTAWTKEWMDTWASREGSEANRFWINNPFASTQDGLLDTTFNAGFGPGIWNTKSVKVYADIKSGVDATVATILDGAADGWYSNILQSLRTQTVLAGCVRDFFIWINGPNGEPSGSNYGPEIMAHMQASTASKEASVPDTTDAILRALTGRTGQDALNTLSAWNKTPLGAYTGYSLIDGYWARKQDLEAVTKAVKDLASGTVSADAIIAGLQEILKRAQQQGVKV